MCASCQQQDTLIHTNEYGTNWQWDQGTIVVETPERPAGQKHVLGLRTPKLEIVRVGFVGLGMRGRDAVARFTYIPGTQVVALCVMKKTSRKLSTVSEKCLYAEGCYLFRRKRV